MQMQIYYAALRYTKDITLQLQLSLNYTTLRYTTLDYTIYITPHYNYSYNYNYNYTAVHYTTATTPLH